MMILHKLDYPSPIGVMEIIGTEEAVRSIMFAEREAPHIPANKNQVPQVLWDCYKQLEEYFSGMRSEFSFPIYMEGTSFQKNVWNTLVTIPYGETTSYSAIATTLGNEKAVRAVGNANGKNRLSIVVPCHRIVGANGSLTGYAGGLWRKDWLLQHEKTNAFPKK
ncbi:methylated-DNA--protein-cysteine methyltransferase [Brevibacillus reuszeri]|uniref:Methylated-DNA--protein-cysteine methyltransferase n=1 Tax=Brevibacillus reuszeri TaxID=54915 RepID=A0A0K9YV39_9BACL|nr:methylated-DNA--[protein]-cysteine S-methyltransferase [Brevibacillus reuszeri]KNB72551.1 cysteine methyltransferase [Brevibacillus reuszeri]MED1860769.1 methylated-DNA--[protein]-cysteine S-methyltransferase [Brevibacillus reuszeri]GED70438.1 methylated-DNA--protein-cysteine methyltransferase [Brevibacillus reuszeri]